MVDLDKLVSIICLCGHESFTWAKQNITINRNGNHIIINGKTMIPSITYTLFKCILKKSINVDSKNQQCCDIDLTQYLSDKEICKRLNMLIDILDPIDDFYKLKTICKTFSEKHKILSKLMHEYILKNYPGTYDNWYLYNNPCAIHYITYMINHHINEKQFYIEMACSIINRINSYVGLDIKIPQNRKKIYTNIIKLLDLDSTQLADVSYKTNKFTFNIPYDEIDKAIGLLSIA